MVSKNTNPLYYFSGTGGCLATAKRLSAEMAEFVPVPIAALAGESSITVDTDTIGLVFPLYYAGLPRIVANFVSRLEFRHLCYVFAVVACGFPWSGWAMHQLGGLLKSKKQKLSAGFYLKMVDNYLPHYDVPAPADLEGIYSRCEEKVGMIIEHIRNRDTTVDKEKAFYLYAMYPYFINALKRYDKHFATDGRCNSCGVCQSVCPVSNITLQDGKPVWRHNCEFCLACISYCPQKTIQWKNITQQKGRYHYKGISAGEITRQRHIEQ